MTKAHSLALLMIILIFSAGNISAKNMTLDECIELALKNHKDVIRARNMEKQASGVVWQSFGAFLPSFSISASEDEWHGTTQLYGVPVEASAKSYTLGGGFYWVPFNGGRNVFNFLGSRADKKYFGNLAESSEQEMIYLVKATYYYYLRAQDKKKIAEEAVKRGEEQFKLAESKFEVGSASKSDVLKAKVQYGNDKLQLITEENNAGIAKADLLYLVGLDVDADVTFDESYQRKKYDGEQADALRFGLAHHPGLLAAQNNLTAAKYDLKSTLARYLPSLSVRLSKNWTNAKWSEVWGFNTEDASWSLSTTLSWAIFENFSKKRDVTRAKTVVSNARAELEYAQNGVALEIKKAHLEIRRAKEALTVAESNEEAAQEDITLIREKYRLGAATILELLDAQVSLVSAQNQKIEADFALSLAIAGLEKAMGQR